MLYIFDLDQVAAQLLVDIRGKVEITLWCQFRWGEVVPYFKDVNSGQQRIVSLSGL
mgnify:CR=1 FL=1